MRNVFWRTSDWSCVAFWYTFCLCTFCASWKNAKHFPTSLNHGHSLVQGFFFKTKLHSQIYCKQRLGFTGFIWDIKQPKQATKHSLVPCSIFFITLTAGTPSPLNNIMFDDKYFYNNDLKGLQCWCLLRLNQKNNFSYGKKTHKKTINVELNSPQHWYKMFPKI